MGEILKRRLRQQRFETPMHEAMLNLLVASAWIQEQLERIVSPHGLTVAQYNVLRILRGVHPDGHPRCEIADRLIDRAPDVTRLIDRLEAKGFVARDRSSSDRRHSMTRITAKGLKLLGQIDPHMSDQIGEFAARMPQKDARELSRLCESLYGAEI